MVHLLLGLHVRALTNSALLLFAQVQTDRVDTIVGQDQELNHARAVQEQQRKQVKLRNIWVRPIICTRAAPADLELASNVEPSLLELHPMVVFLVYFLREWSPSCLSKPTRRASFYSFDGILW